MKIASYENFLPYGMGGGKKQAMHGSKQVMGIFFFFLQKQLILILVLRHTGSHSMTSRNENGGSWNATFWDHGVTKHA